MFSGKNILRKEKHFLLFDSIVEITLENYFMCLVLHRKKPISRKCKHKPATTTKHNPPPTTQNPDWEEKKKKNPPPLLYCHQNPSKHHHPYHHNNNKIRDQIKRKSDKEE